LVLTQNLVWKEETLSLDVLLFNASGWRQWTAFTDTDMRGQRWQVGWETQLHAGQI